MNRGDAFLDHPHPSRRMPVFARRVVATSQPLAVQAGLDAMRRGGNAVDAALAAAITLTVVEPTSNGIGGDAFAIVWDGSALHGYNGSGRAPAAWTPERFAGASRMPTEGWDAVTVPGAVAAWADLSARFGRLPFAELFADAIRHAAEGFPVSPITSWHWARAAERFAGHADFAAAFLPGGRAPMAGALFRQPEQAETLAAIAASGGTDFYRGALAARIAAASRAAGGALAEADLTAHAGEWVEPMSMDYGNLALHELPPNGQGVAALIALGILVRLEAKRPPANPAEALHLRVEAMRAGLALAEAEVAEPGAMRIAPPELLDPARLDALAAGIDRERAAPPADAPPDLGGTVLLVAADGEGRMVAFIQSNYMGFGSGIVVPGTGVALQNRGAGFALSAGHPNRVAGGKRPFHTIIPAFVTRNGVPLLAYGVMGGRMQAQGHLQLFLRLFADGESPQAAADAPRWQLREDGRLALEDGFPPGLAAALGRRGHVPAPPLPGWGFGGAQLVLKIEGGFCAASDPRKDGQAAGF